MESSLVPFNPSYQAEFMHDSCILGLLSNGQTNPFTEKKKGKKKEKQQHVPNFWKCLKVQDYHTESYNFIFNIHKDIFVIFLIE